MTQYAIYHRDRSEARAWRFEDSLSAQCAAMRGDVRDCDKPWLGVVIAPHPRPVDWDAYLKDIRGINA